jgi:hypothetical protein
MKISGALKALMKKMEYYHGHELAGILVSRTTNPINYFKAIRLLPKDGRQLSKETPSTNNSAPSSDRIS